MSDWKKMKSARCSQYNFINKETAFGPLAKAVPAALLQHSDVNKETYLERAAALKYTKISGLQGDRSLLRLLRPFQDKKRWQVQESR